MRVPTCVLAGVLAIAGAIVAPTPLTAQAAGQAAGQTAKPAANFKELTRAELDALLKTPNGILILDLRRPDELQSIGGFPVYLSIQPDALEASLASIPRERTIITVSNHTSRSGRAAELLARHGFKVAGAIGAQNYESAGGTLVKVAPKAQNEASEASAKR